MAFSPPSLADILRQLSFDGRIALTNGLRSAGALKAARSACKALLEVVDGSLTAVTVHLQHGDMQRCRDGQRVPLSRWTALTDITVDLSQCFRVVGRKSPQRAALAMLPFVGQPASCLHRITSLQVEDPPEFIDGRVFDSPQVASVAIPALMQRLPNLRHLKLDVALSDNPYEQQILYDALAVMPYLTSLVLPSIRALKHIGMLADSLTELVVLDRIPGNHIALAEAPELLRGLAKLRRLTDLKVHVRGGVGYKGMALLRALLNGLPSSLKRLAFPCCGLLHPWHRPTVEICLDAGYITSVHFTSDGVALGSLTAFARDALFPSRAMGQRLELLSFKSLWLWDLCVEQPAVRDLQRLLEACSAVEVGVLVVDNAPDDGDWTVDELCSKLNTPNVLELGCGGRYLRLGLRPEPPLGAGAGASPQQRQWQRQPGWDRGEPAGELPELPELWKVLDMALERMASHAASGASDVQEGDDDESVPVLMLRGSFVARLCSAADPDAVHRWMSRLAERVDAAAVATGQQRQQRQGAGLVAHFREYVTLPSCGAVLVSCRTAAVSAAVRAAAQALAAGESTATSSESTATGDAARLEVAPVAVAVPDGQEEPGNLNELLLCGVSEVIQDVRVQCAGGGTTGPPGPASEFGSAGDRGSSSKCGAGSSNGSGSSSRSGDGGCSGWHGGTDAGWLRWVVHSLWVALRRDEWFRAGGRFVHDLFDLEA